MEVWLDVNGFEDFYQISNKGRVRSKDRIVKYKDGRSRKFYGKILSLNTDKDGYKLVHLYVEQSRTIKKVHRLVAEHFIDNFENKPEVDHINTIRSDNRVENLKWCTSKENKNNKLTKLKRLKKWRK